MVWEHTNYAFGYDPEHGGAHCLMGMLYMYFFKEYKEAEICFDTAIACKPDYTETYAHFSLLRIWMGEFDKAEALISFAMKIKGVDYSLMHFRKSIIYECQGEYMKAIQSLNLAIRHSMDPENRDLFISAGKRMDKHLRRQKQDLIGK